MTNLARQLSPEQNDEFADIDRDLQHWMAVLRGDLSADQADLDQLGSAAESGAER